MSVACFCAERRLRLWLLRQSHATIQHRRWLTYHSRKSRVPVEPPADGQKPSGSTRYSRPWLDQPNAATANASRSQEQSHEHLRPAQLLEQLESHHEVRQPVQKPGRDNFPQSRVSPELREKIGSMFNSHTRHNDAARSPDLIDLVQKTFAGVYDAEELRICVDTSPPLRHALSRWALETGLSWALKERDITMSSERISQSRNTYASLGFNAVKPSLAICFFHEVVPSSNSIWRKSLLKLAYMFLEMQSTSELGDVQLRLGARELLSIWNQCMRATVLGAPTEPDRPARSQFRDPLSLSVQSGDWTFLPNVQALSDSILRTRHGRFDQLFNLLVPSIAGGQINTRSDGSDTVSDNHVCAALITMKLFETIRDENGAIIGETEAFKPWMTMMRAILNASEFVDVPPTLARRRESRENPAHRNAYDNVISSYATAPSLLTTKTAASPVEDGRPLTPKTGDQLVKSQHLSSSDSTKPSANPAESTEGIEATKSAPTVQGRDDDLSVEPGLSGDAEMDQFAISTIKRLGRAMESQNLNYAQRIHQGVLKLQASRPNKRIPADVYEHLMLAYIGLRDPALALTVWNQFHDAGHKPTSKTYTSMMRGARYVRDIDGMWNVWNNMRDSGVQPEAPAWSVLIIGLFRSRRNEEGMQCLRNLASEWLAAARAAYWKERRRPPPKDNSVPTSAELIEKYKGDVDGAVRPDNILMNSAISALAGGTDVLIPKVLAWGRSFGVEPNVTTYNVLLNISLRHKLSGESDKILQRMSERGMSANSETWTVLLNSIFESGTLDNLSQEEQEKEVMRYIDQMKHINSSKGVDQEGGFQLDQKGYALLIDRLLKRYNNRRAAQTVMQHMVSQGIRPNTHIYTILLTAYFQSSPPEFDAIESLWRATQSAEHGYGHALDSVFYDRMIEGYAQHHRMVGSSAPMLQALARMESEGKKASWKALLAAAECLASRGEWEQLEHLVANARTRLEDRRPPGSPLLHETMRTGRKEFWDFVVRSGVLAREGITTVDQLLSSTPARGKSLGGSDSRGQQGAGRAWR